MIFEQRIRALVFYDANVSTLVLWDSNLLEAQVPWGLEQI